MATVTRALVRPPLAKGKLPTEAAIKNGTVHELVSKGETDCGRKFKASDARWVSGSGGKKKCTRCKSKSKARVSKPRVRKPAKGAAPSVSNVLPAE